MREEKKGGVNEGGEGEGRGARGHRVEAEIAWMLTVRDAKWKE